MKPASFEYHDPATLDEALELVAEYGEQARALAGGQSLVPMMNFRLLRPAHIIDLNRIRELDFLAAEAGQLKIGAMLRQRALERSRDVASRWPLLSEATSFVGHIQIRNRGTVGGSLAHAFPTAELPVAMITLRASFTVRSKSNQRTVAANEFFEGYMTTALQPTELLTEIIVPAIAPKSGSSYQEVSRRHGDFALAGAAALITLDSRSRIDQVRLTFTGAVPISANRIEEQLRGQPPADNLFKDAAHEAAQTLEQDSDIHASAEYRREACAALAARALTQAAARAADAARAS